MKCGVSETNLKLSLLMYSSYFVLFARFFYNTYMAHRQQAGKQKYLLQTEKAHIGRCVMKEDVNCAKNENTISNNKVEEDQKLNEIADDISDLDTTNSTVKVLDDPFMDNGGQSNEEPTLESKEITSIETKELSSSESKDVTSLPTKEMTSLETKEGPSLETKKDPSIEINEKPSLESKEVPFFDVRKESAIEEEEQSLETEEVSSIEVNKGIPPEGKPSVESQDEPSSKEVSDDALLKNSTSTASNDLMKCEGEDSQTTKN